MGDADGHREWRADRPPADNVACEGLTFSPDGDYVYYVRRVGNSPAELYRVPTLGGTPKKLLVDLETAVDFSPDGDFIACPAADRNFTGELKAELVAVSLNDGSEKLLNRQ